MSEFNKNYWWDYITNVLNTVRMNDIEYDSFNYLWVINQEIIDKLCEDLEIETIEEPTLCGIKVKVDESNTNGVRIFKELEYWNKS